MKEAKKEHQDSKTKTNLYLQRKRPIKSPQSDFDYDSSITMILMLSI